MSEPSNTERRPYHSPKLRVHGTVAELTLLGPGALPDSVYGGDQRTPPTS